jgi:hypothetical protein
MKRVARILRDQISDLRLADAGILEGGQEVHAKRCIAVELASPRLPNMIPAGIERNQDATGATLIHK